MKLSVFSLKKILFQGEASFLNCKTAMGEVTILDDHHPLIGIIKEGAIRIIDSSKEEHFFPVKSGFLEVRPNNETRCIVEE